MGQDQRLETIHAEWGRRWSGGAGQVFTLLLGLHQANWGIWLVASEGSPLLKKALQKGLKGYGFHLKSEFGLPTWLSLRRWMGVTCREAMTRGKKILVHIHSRRGLLGTTLVAKSLRLPLVVHWRVAAPFPRLIARLTDAFIGISQASLQAGINAGIPSEKVFLIPSAIRVDDWLPSPGIRDPLRASMGIPPDAFVFISTGRLAPGKGHDVALRALAEIPPRTKPFLLIVGTGETEEQLRSLAQTLKVDQFVRFIPFQDDIRPYLWAADAFVHAPDRFPEGLSVAILEAMAAGLPVIASRKGGIVDAVVDGKTGFLATPGDPQDLADKMAVLSSDPEIAITIGKAAKVFVEQHHNVEGMIGKVAQVYQKALSHCQLARGG
ncbi:MAG: glycosyltransferase family 4 protein [Armatimonadetes bacterium]|nr:glycosyltransferase family 4 protein [Armatimonadota bacterium]MDW8120698.1 glycosyltransferase family 4 protein [Armatimonadota bacterium]